VERGYFDGERRRNPGQIYFLMLFFGGGDSLLSVDLRADAF
jgi:hypothetical protein